MENKAPVLSKENNFNVSEDDLFNISKGKFPSKLFPIAEGDSLTTRNLFEVKVGSRDITILDESMRQQLAILGVNIEDRVNLDPEIKDVVKSFERKLIEFIANGSADVSTLRPGYKGMYRFVLSVDVFGKNTEIVVGEKNTQVQVLYPIVVKAKYTQEKCPWLIRHLNTALPIPPNKCFVTKDNVQFVHTSKFGGGIFKLKNNFYVRHG